MSDTWTFLKISKSHLKRIKMYKFLRQLKMHTNVLLFTDAEGRNKKRKNLSIKIIVRPAETI